LSKKAQQTIEFCNRSERGSQICVPEIKNGPVDTIKELRTIIDVHKGMDIMLIGSSLGGFYATFLSEEYDLPAVLINPAVRPFDACESLLGEHRNYYSDTIHSVTEEHLDELLQLERSPLMNPDNFWVLVQTGDEVLDYRLAVEKYGEKNCLVREKGSHSYDNFEGELPAVFEFLLSSIGQSVR
jgi:hypothetical protein